MSKQITDSDEIRENLCEQAENRGFICPICGIDQTMLKTGDENEVFCPHCDFCFVFDIVYFPKFE